MSTWPNVQPSKRSVHLATINPQSATTAKSTGWVNASLFHSFKAKVVVGAFATSAVINAKLEQATSDGGSPKDVTGKAIAALTQAGTDDDKQAIIELRQADLDVANDYDWFRLTITPTVDAVLIYGEIEGLDPVFGSGTAAATVDEVV
jgi:hypothetical protein